MKKYSFGDIVKGAALWTGIAAVSFFVMREDIRDVKKWQEMFNNPAVTQNIISYKDEIYRAAILDDNSDGINDRIIMYTLPGGKLKDNSIWLGYRKEVTSKQEEFGKIEKLVRENN